MSEVKQITERLLKVLPNYDWDTGLDLTRRPCFLTRIENWVFVLSDRWLCAYVAVEGKYEPRDRRSGLSYYINYQQPFYIDSTKEFKDLYNTLVDLEKETYAYQQDLLNSVLGKMLDESD